jgi:spoIIIJ-associated protein
MTDLHDEQTPSTTEPALDADQRAALSFIEEACAASGLDLHPVVQSVQPPYLHLELAGEDARATFGRMGQALDALQFLANLILMRRIASDVRVVLDAASYRERRADALRHRALELASEVKARNEEAELEPLPAHERRIVHTVLADDPDIRTYSEGDEPDRRVVISPRR